MHYINNGHTAIIYNKNQNITTVKSLMRLVPSIGFVHSETMKIRVFYSSFDTFNYAIELFSPYVYKLIF